MNNTVEITDTKTAGNLLNTTRAKIRQAIKGRFTTTFSTRGYVEGTVKRNHDGAFFDFFTTESGEIKVYPAN